MPLENLNVDRPELIEAFEADRNAKKAAEKKNASNADEGEKFVVEKILDKRIVHGKIQYLCKWKDYEE